MGKENWTLAVALAALVGVAVLGARAIGDSPRARALISSGSKYEALAAYSRAVVDGDWIFVSGTVGFDPATGEFAAEIGAQTEQVFSNISQALAEAGADLGDVVRTRICLTDAGDIETVAEILRRHFADTRPANITLVCSLMVPEARIEIEVTARKR